MVYRRQFEADAKHFSPELTFDELVVTRNQWYRWADALLETSRVVINPISAARRAENKILQLREAESVGFRTPETLVTNSSLQAQAFVEEHGTAVVKSLATAYYEGSDSGFVFTNVLDSSILSMREQWTHQPVIVQERIAASRHARVIAFNDGRVFGGSLSTWHLDWRRDDQASWVNLEMKPEVVTGCVSYLRGFGLYYAAFDFIVDEAGEFWFLEANQGGEWHFLDRRLHLGISDHFAHFLSSML